MTSSADLLEHQRGDIEWIHAMKRGLLGNEPGLGKSRSAIEAFDGGRNLVIAPNLVIEGGTWREELEKWSADPSKWTVAPYSMLNDRIKTKGSGTKPINRLREEWRGKWDAVVVDEAHYTKGRNTTWTWAVEEIAKRSGHVLEMTGTPMPNWAHELFMPLRVIYPDEAHPGKMFGSFWRWAEQWFDTSPTRWSNGNPVVGEMLGCMRAGIKECLARPSHDPCEHYQRFTAENLGGHFRRMLRDDCLDLPPITTQVVEVSMTTAQRRVYNELKKQFVTTVNGNEVVAWSQGALNVMLDRVTTSPWILDPDGPPRGGKFEQLAYDLQSRSRPTLVLAHYRATVDACAEVARQIGADAGVVHGGISDAAAGRTVEDFKRGRLDVLVGSLETLAEGLTLTVADMAIFVEMSYKPSRNEQARFRVHRLGQERPVTIREYVTPKSVDAKKRKLLATKTDRQMRVLTAAQFADLL